MKTDMTLERVRELLNAFDEHNIEYCVIAGWALDGVRGYQSRLHQDIDILCLKRDADRILQITDDLGYTGVWYNDLYKVKRIDGAKADLAMATIEKDEIVTYGRIAITRIPLELFRQSRYVMIESCTFRIACIEILKTYACYAQKGSDADFVKGIRTDETLVKRISRVLR